MSLGTTECAVEVWDSRLAEYSRESETAKRKDDFPLETEVRFFPSAGICGDLCSKDRNNVTLCGMAVPLNPCCLDSVYQHLKNKIK